MEVHSASSIQIISLTPLGHHIYLHVITNKDDTLKFLSQKNKRFKDVPGNCYANLEAQLRPEPIYLMCVCRQQADCAVN